MLGLMMLRFVTLLCRRGDFMVALLWLIFVTLLWLMFPLDVVVNNFYVDCPN